MAFIKTSRVPISTIAEAEFDSTSDTIVFKRSASKQAPSYQADTKKLNIRSLLEMVADEYNISKDPHDYIFEAVRAVTAEVPNENGDGFPRSELLRFDHRLGKAVYQTFIGKPHHINHRADNPKTSRGVVLDASYNELSPALDDCPSCGQHTAGLEGRDKSGINCIKCGTAVRDEFVELLLAIDTKKDPTFAEGVRVGSLDSLSMGCEAQYTDCSICDNRAHTVAEFCSHIRSGNKKKMFKTASGMKMSYEKCGGVVFTEISRVDQPADPSAKQREIFQVSNMPLSMESEMLVMASKIAKLEGMVKEAQTINGLGESKLVEETSPQVPFKNVAESIKWAESSIHKLKAEVHRLTAEKAGKHKEASDAGRPFYAWENAVYDAQIKANRQYIARLEDYVNKAREMQASGAPWEKGLTRQMSRFFASKDAQVLPEVQKQTDQLEQLKVMHPDLAPTIDQLIPDEANNVADQMSIDDYAKKHEESFDKNVTPGEMGMKLDETGGLPTTVASKIVENKIASELDALLDAVKENTVSTGTKVYKFAAPYGHLEATVTKSGNVKVHTSAGTLFVIRPETKPTDKDSGERLATEILTHIADNGIVETVNKYNTIVAPKMAQVLEYHLEDFAKGREEGDKKGMPEDAEFDHTDGREKPEKSLVTEEHTDRKDMVREKRDQSKSDVLEEHQPDHKDAYPAGYKPAAAEEHSDMADGHGKPAKNTLKDVVVDFKDKQPKSAGKQAQMDMCTCQPNMCKCGPDCQKCNPDMSKCGCPCGSKMAQDMAPPAAPPPAPATMGSPAPMPMAADTKKYVSRVERLYKARLEKVEKDSASKVASLEKEAATKVAGKLLRALRLASKRQILNLESSPMKEAMFDVLTTQADLDSESFYPGMDESTAAHLVEAATSAGLDSLVDSLMKRASEFMDMSEDAFSALENDVKNLRPAGIQVTASRKSEVQDDLRKEAERGNFVLAPTSSETTISDGDGRNNIRSALGSTKVRRASQVLLKR